MFVTKNTIGDLVVYMRTSLSELYDDVEIERLILMAFDFHFEFNKLDLRMKKDQELSESELLKIHFLVKDLKLGKPIQHLLGGTWFYDHWFKVSSDVLIPRQETEELVDWCLKTNSDEPIKVIDFCTGSGCIAISLKSNRPTWKVFASDVSKCALVIAKENAVENKTDVRFEEFDLLQDVPKETQFHLIVSNPPYIPEKEKVMMDRLVVENDPQLALFVPDETPLLFYERIAELGQSLLLPNGCLAFEIHQFYGNEVVEMMRAKSYTHVEIIKDLNSNDRIVVGYKG